MPHPSDMINLSGLRLSFFSRKEFSAKQEVTKIQTDFRSAIMGACTVPNLIDVSYTEHSLDYRNDYSHAHVAAQSISMLHF